MQSFQCPHVVSSPVQNFAPPIALASSPPSLKEAVESPAPLTCELFVTGTLAKRRPLRKLYLGYMVARLFPAAVALAQLSLLVCFVFRLNGVKNTRRRRKLAPSQMGKRLV